MREPNNTEKYSAAVIGTGRIGMMLEADKKRLKPATHFGMWSSHPEFKLEAICDNDPEKFNFAKSHDPSIACYTRPDELLSKHSPDVISISTWRDSHYAIMKLALDHDVSAIVCEKPIAEKEEHAREIVAEANRKGIHLLINHRRRFDPLLYPLKEEISSGIIGEIIQVHCTYVFGLLSTGTHLVDTLRMLLTDVAGEVTWVSAHTPFFQSYHPEDDPNLDGFIGFENGLKVSIQSLSMKDYDSFDFHIYGRNGKIIFKNIGRDIEIYKVNNSVEHEGFTELENSPSIVRGGSPRDQFRFMADNVVECLRGRGTSLSSGEDSLKALEILIAMRKSAANAGAIIKLSQFDNIIQNSRST